MSDFKRQKLNLPDADEMPLDGFSTRWLHDLLSDIDATLKENATQREKYPEEPLKFLESETTLYAQTKTLSNISQSPELFTETQSIAPIIQALIQHPNSDIVIQLSVTLADFIDPEYEEHQSTFIPWLLDSQILLTLLDTRETLATTLEMMTRLCTYDSFKTHAQTSLTEPFFTLLSNLITAKVDAIMPLAYELAYTLVSLDVHYICSQASYVIEVLMVGISKLTETEIRESTESGADDLVDLLALCISTSKGYDVFVQYEGFELLIWLMKKEVDWCFVSFLRLAGITMQSLTKRQNVELATSIVNSNLFLKNVFSHFKGNEKALLRVLLELLVFLPFNSKERVRVINKICKPGKGLSNTIRKHLKKLDAQVRSVSELVGVGESEGPYAFDDVYLEKVESGLDTLQIIMLIQAWLLIEDEEFRRDLLSNGVSVKQVKEVLAGFEDELVFNYEHADEGETKEDTFENLSMVRELLSSLNTF